MSIIKTDEHYTPQEVKKVIRKYAMERGYITPNTKLITPFYVGGDYTKEDYTDRVVFDNPPFSIFKQIINYYNSHDIPFFLYYNGKTAFGVYKYTTKPVTIILVHQHIIYLSGVAVQTCFVTNIDPYTHDLCKRNSLILSKDLSQDLYKVTPRRWVPKRKPLPHIAPLDYDATISPMQLEKYIRRLKHDTIFYIKDVSDRDELGRRIYGGGVRLIPSSDDKMGAT